MNRNTIYQAILELLRHGATELLRFWGGSSSASCFPRRQWCWRNRDEIDMLEARDDLQTALCVRYLVFRNRNKVTIVHRSLLGTYLS